MIRNIHPSFLTRRNGWATRLLLRSPNVTVVASALAFSLPGAIIQKLSNCANESKLQVFKAAEGKAVGLTVVTHVAAATAEVQAPAASGGILRTTPVVADRTAIAKNSRGVAEVPGSMKL